MSDALPGVASGLGDVFDDDAPSAVGAAESSGDCHDGSDDDDDGVADDGCGDDPSTTSLSDTFVNPDGSGRLSTFDAIADALQVDTSIAGIDIEIAEPAVGDNANTDGIDFVTDATTGDVDFALTISLDGEFDAPVNLPTELIDLVAVGGEGVFQVPVSLTSVPLQFHFDFDQAFDSVGNTTAATVAEALWLQTNPSLAVAGSTAAPAFTLEVGDGTNDDLSDIDGELSLGFAGVDVDGFVALRLLYTLSLIDPDSLNGGASDFKIVADELVNTDLDELVDITPGSPSPAAATAEFEINTSLIPGDVDLTITATSATLADLADPAISFDPGSNDLAVLENLRSFTPTDALGAIDRLVGMLGGIQSTGFLDLDLPYLDGGTCNNGVDDDGDGKADDGCLGSTEPVVGTAETGATGTFSDVISLGGALGEAVTDAADGLVLPPDPETLASDAPSFDNAQELLTKLDSGLGAKLKDVTGDDITLSLDTADPNAPRLLYELTIADEATNVLDLEFGNLDVVNDLVIDAGGEALMQAGYEIPIKFALDLAPEPVEDGAGPGSCSDGEDNGGADGADGLDGVTDPNPDTSDDDCKDSRTLEQRVSIYVGETAGERDEVKATAGLQATNISATARVGFLTVGITNGKLMLGNNTAPEDCLDAGDLDSASCLASFDVDLVDAGDGWLTIEELYDALGNPDGDDYSSEWSRTVDHQAGLYGSLTVGADLEGVDIPGADLTITGGSTGLLESSAPPAPGEPDGFLADKLVESLEIDAADLQLSEIFNFSACGNDEDDDGDGAADDGCGGTGDPDAVEAPESESIALFDVILDAVRALAAQVDSDALPDEFSEDLPFIGKSYKDVFDLATTLEELAEAAALGAESFLGAGACTNATDDDGDGFINDGCPQAGAFAEGGAQCVGTNNDDQANEATDGTTAATDESAANAVVNDGCPAVAPSLQNLDSVLDTLLTTALASGLDTSLGAGAVEVDTTFDEATDDLSFAIDIAPFSVARSFPFVASLPNSLPDLVSLGTTGAVSVEVAGSGNIDFGIDLDDFSPYVLGSSDLQLQMNAALDDPTVFEAGVGPLTLDVGKTTPGAETGCAEGDTTDDDDDGFVNDGCGSVGDAENNAAGDCSYGDAVNQDGDGLVNDGCPARTDSVRAFIGAQLHIVEEHDDDEKVALTDVGFTGGLAGGDVVGGVEQPECLDVNITSSPSAATGTPKHACAILPLYFEDDPIGTVDTTEHHVLLAVADLGSPGTISAQYDGFNALDTIIAEQVLDMLLFESGIQPLIDKLLALINDNLLGVDLPVIGEALDQVVALANGLGDLASSIGTVLQDGDPLAALEATTNASQVESLFQTEIAEALGQALIDAGILLTDAPGRVAATDPSAVTARVRCGDDRPCDYGAETAEPNPAADPPSDADADNANNCDQSNTGDDDGDGFFNDGCGVQPNPETEADCLDPGDGDGDGVDNDGCEGTSLAVGDAESNCDGADDDGDTVADDGCPWPATNPAGYGADGTGSEASIDGACDEGDTVDDDQDGFLNDGCPEHHDSAADVSDVAVLFRIGQAATASTGTFGFDAGIDGLGLELEGANLNATAGWDLDIGMGVSKELNFYFVTDQLALYGADGDGVGPELSADATILISDPAGAPATLTGTLAFLEAKATDGSSVTDPDSDAPAPPAPDDANGVTIPSGRSFLNIGATVDLEDPGPVADNRLALAEITAGPSFSELIDFTFDGSAELHLGLEVGVSESVAQGMPRLTTGLHLTWGWAVTAGEDPDDLEPAPGDLQIWMDGLYLDAGSFVSEFLAPVFADVQRFTKAFEPIIDVLNEPIPVLSDFAGEPVTMRTLGETLAAAYDLDLTLIDMVIDLIDFVNSIKSFDEAGNPSMLIPLTSTANESLDLNATRLRQGTLPSSQALEAYASGQLGEMVSDLQGAINAKVGGQGSASSNESSGGSLTIGNLDSVGISFPFLEHPERLAGLLFGQHVTLVQWEPPPLVMKFCYSQKFGPIWAVPPVFIEFGGCVGLTGRFGIGYNTKGFERALFDPNGDVSGLLQGLFLIDRHPLEGGPDSNELEFRGEIFVNAQVSVLIFSAGAQGSLYLQIGIDLEDPNNDGITEFGEAANIIRTTGSVLCLFNLNGQLGLEISVFAEVDLFFWSQRWTKVLADIVLYEFKIKCDPLDEPELARPASGSGTLFLNMGDDARFRDADDTGPDNSMGYDVIDEKWTVTRTPDGVKVRALGFTQSYPGSWSKVEVTNAGGGEDAVAFLDGQLGGEEGAQCATGDSDDDDNDGATNDGCDAQAHTDDPTLPIPENAPSNPTYAGNDADSDPANNCDNNHDDDGDGFVNDGCPIVGDIVIIEFDIPIDVTMGDGNDTVSGGAGGGEMHGGGDADVLLGRGDTAYTITGGSGADSITGSYDGDDIDAGPDDDSVDGGPGDDKIVGGTGADTLDGGRTAKSDPAAGPIVVFPDLADEIWGDEEDADSGTDHGDDTIDGGEDADELHGGGGADRISGGPGADDIFGGDETNDGCGGDVDDTIIGGPGSDDIDAQDGDDIVVGGNTIAGEPDVGDELLAGGEGCDIVLGDNAVFDSDSNPRTFQLLDANIGGAETEISGGPGDDIIRGQAGNDVIFGDVTADSASGDGVDQIWGDHGNDVIQAGGGDDTVYGDGGPSHPQFADGNDTIAGAGGRDTLRGEGGTDTIFGDHGSLGGLLGTTPVFANDGDGDDDNIQGGSENDRIYGQEGDDVVNGDGGDDEIHGDTDTTQSGNDGNDDLRGGTGNDRMFGGTGADTMNGDAGNDHMAGGSQTEGNADTGSFGGFQDRMFGGSGTDVMTGDNAQLTSVVTLLDESTIGEGDLMYGQLDDDDMFGENGNDLMFGGAGDDHMEGGDNSDTIYGEADQDDIIGGTTQPANAPATGQQPDEGDFLYGQGDPDVIIGDNGAITRTEPEETWPGGAVKRAVTLYDLDATDTGYAGTDVIEGGQSADEAYGGAEDDYVYGFTAAGAGALEDGNDHLEGNNGADEVYGDAGQDDIIGGTSALVDENGPDSDPVAPDDGGSHPDIGKDLLHGGDGATSLTGDHDVVMGDNATVERVLASAVLYQFDDLDASPLGGRTATDGVLRRRIVLHDVATTTFTPTSPAGATADGDELYGESGWDELYAQGGDDLIRGGANDDHVEGGAGEDELYGDEGQDDLIGGTGRTVNDDTTTAADLRLDGADTIYGGDGSGGVTVDDFDVEMGDNATILRGEPGDAWAYNTFNASIRRSVYQYDVGLADAPAAAGTFGVDVMRGEADDDLMYGQGAGDDMDGADGDDHMQGNEGADTIVGAGGNDDMIGGTGRINDDPVEGTPGRLDSGETEMRGGDGFDWMTGDNAIVERVLVDGEWVTNPNGGIYRHVVRMPDLFDGEAPFGGSRDESQVSGADTMFGDADHDVLYGQGNGDRADDVPGDIMHGGFGQDHVEGNEGADEIHGDAGEDDLVGGTGKVLGADSFTHDEYAALDADDSDPDLDLAEEVDAQLDFGVRNRHDGDDVMTGESDTSDGGADTSDADVMLGDNGIVLRSISNADNDDQFPVGTDGEWKVRTENDSVERNPWFPDVESVDLPAVDATVHGDDDMWGNDNDDEMWGQGGDDLMFGGSGDDRMQGNHASDEMHGGPQEDDMLGGTGRVNDDPDEGTPGRLDMDDLMFGDDEDDVMTGDNAIIDRPIDGGQWRTTSYKGYPDATHKAAHVAGKTANKNTAPLATGDFETRVVRALVMFDLAEDLGGSPDTAGSDLMSGGPGDDDMVGQFDDSDDAGAPFLRTKEELTVLCDSPDESTLFGTADTVTTYGDIVCGNRDEDAILGDQGVIVNRAETEGRQKLLIPNTPFSRDWVFIDDTLSRLVTLDQFLEGGHDVILGGDHHDAIHAGAGGDLTNGDDGDDFIFGNDGGEIDKGTRQDALWGGRGHDTSFGGWGDDFVDVQPRTNIANFPDDPADWLFFAPPKDELGFFRGFASIDHHYGGWDQDAFQADLGDNGPIHGDRLMDWVGAYNVYYLCPSTYGAWVSLRDQPPDALKHMEDLADGLGATDVTTPGSSGFREAAIVYKPDIESNQEPPHPDTPGHFVCDGINYDDPTWTSAK